MIDWLSEKLIDCVCVHHSVCWYMYSHVACDVMKERTLYLLKPSSLIWHLMPHLFLFITFDYLLNWIWSPVFALLVTVSCFCTNSIELMWLINKKGSLSFQWSIGALITSTLKGAIIKTWSDIWNIMNIMKKPLVHVSMQTADVSGM